MIVTLKIFKLSQQVEIVEIVRLLVYIGNELKIMIGLYKTRYISTTITQYWR